MSTSLLARVMACVLIAGCAAEEASEEDEDVGRDEAAAIHIGDLTRRIKAAAGARPTPEVVMDKAAEMADDKCRPPSDFVGPYAGVPVTMTVTVENGAVRSVAIAAPQTGTQLGTCVQNALMGQQAPKSLGFTRTKTFLVGAPKKRK